MTDRRVWSGPAGAITNLDTVKVYLGKKQYELSNHLGNVITTVSDKKIAIENNNDSIIDYYVGDIISSTDYYAFGSPMPGRKFSSTSYRYGYNGKENDDEVKGVGNSIDFGARIYDPRLGRWLACDPYSGKTPFLSPYNYVSNSPIIAIDPNGKEIIIVNNDPDFRAKTFAALQKQTDKQLVLLTSGKVVEAAQISDMPSSSIEMKGTVTQVLDESGKPIIKVEGTALVSELIAHTQTVKIKNANEQDKRANTYNQNVTMPDDKDKQLDLIYGVHDKKENKEEITGNEGFGDGTGCTIYFNPTSMADGTSGPGILNKNGTYGRPPQIGLGHELGHGLNMANGVVDLGDSGYTQPEDGTGVDNEENAVRDLEASLRAEQGVEPRAPVVPN